MSSKGHPHKHAPGRHKAPHYGAAHYTKTSSKPVAARMPDQREPAPAGRGAKPGPERGQ
ncbi:hypothetical protein AAC691_10215 [Nguyenibacter vanlangensis]|uniref:Uncharacterized protein n=2 Tax=Nguyenibacter vanlangensis TaxID=1216886 RepID=A0ABZ3DBE5_9PROT